MDDLSNLHFFMKTYCPGGGFILVSHLHHGSLHGFPGETLGVIAQLVERLNGIEEVWGSNPHGSTKCFSLRRKGKRWSKLNGGFEPWSTAMPRSAALDLSASTLQSLRRRRSIIPMAPPSVSWMNPEFGLGMTKTIGHRVKRVKK